MQFLKDREVFGVVLGDQEENDASPKVKTFPRHQEQQENAWYRDHMQIQSKEGPVGHCGDI
jgi:hypothetical protein